MKTDGHHPIAALPKASEAYHGIGLTKREYFAALFMQGMIIGVTSDEDMVHNFNMSAKEAGMAPERWMCRQSILQADQFIQELNREA